MMPALVYLPILPALIRVLAVAADSSAASSEREIAPSPAANPSAASSVQGGACALSASGIRLYLVASPVRATDSLVRVSVCLNAPLSHPSQMAIGSLRAVITFDTLAARVATVGGARANSLAINPRKGTIEFAGAAPQGFAGGELFWIDLRLATKGALPPFRLDVVEAADRQAQSVVARLSTGSLGPPDCAAHAETSVRLSTLTPTVAEAGEVAVVEVSGCGFDAADNTVNFGTIVIRNVPSTAGGTRLSFRVPTEVRTGREVPPMLVESGKYPVTVRTARATTNALVFTLR